MVKRVACFLTCGYTEAGAMQFFLKKINNNFEYKQYLPNRTIKRKGDPKNISSSISGLTGEALLEKVYSIIEKYNDEIRECAAILIEDDLDDRFLNFSQDKIDEYNRKIKENVQQKVGRDIPVYILYAAPEIESWFVADWENGFEFLYSQNSVVSDIEKNGRTFFTHHLKQYIESEVLKEYCEDIEKYGVFDGEYKKLSDQLIKAIQVDIKDYISNLHGTNKQYVKQIVDSRCLYYSKRLHGDMMLRNILPENVGKGCLNYFRNTYFELQGFVS